MQIFPILLIFFGESLSIYSEVIAAKNLENFAPVLIKMSVLIAIAGIFLIAGYMLGVKYLGSIWIVGVVSIASIVIMEPLINYIIFHQLPSKGALTGLILGILGLLSAVFLK